MAELSNFNDACLRAAVGRVTTQRRSPMLPTTYGRRVELDRSWTVHHVFTGVPAHIYGVTMVGLSRSDATDIMLSLNRRIVRKNLERNPLVRCSSTLAKEASEP